MAILENIRKRTTVLILVIALALFAFIVSGIFTADNFGGGKIGSSVAEVNGEDISVDVFRRKMDIATRNNANNTSSMQLVNNVFDQEVRSAILSQQFDDLGINIEEDQIMNYIKNIPGYAQSPQFQDENGFFDEGKFRDFILDMKERNDGSYQLWLQDEKNIIQSNKEQTYYNLIKAGVGATLKEGELDYKLANDKIDLRYVRIPFSSIPDSSIAVSKGEIESYIKAHEEDFKQEKSRDIQFVYFEEKASAADETAAKEELVKLMDNRAEYNESTKQTDTILGFRNTSNIGEFLDRYSDIKFDTIFKSRGELPVQFADTLLNLKVGETYGPYRDGNYFKISKMVARKAEGSVKASHILVAYEGAQRANPEVKRTKEEAEERAKELLRDSKKAGADFAELAKANSDGGSAPTGGDLGFFRREKMVPAFSDFAFANKIGNIGMVETEFGFHVIKVDDKQDLVQIGHLARLIEASEETINTLFTDATKFEMATTSGEKNFPDLAKDENYTVRNYKARELDENIPGLGTQRGLVQWIFNDDTELGDIKRFNVNNGYAIAQLTAIYREGTMSVEDASARVLPLIRKERKADQIIAQYQGKSMEDIASDSNVTISNATALTVKSPTIPGAGSEPVVVGTAYAMNEGETSGLIEGQSGVFMINVTRKEEAAQLDNYSTYANTLTTTSTSLVTTAVYNALKEASEIEDNRATFY
jgi:peptidyl-prolyl cis-trans isomerase D